MICSNNRVHARKIAAEAGAFFNPSVDCCLSREEGGVLFGGVVYTAFTGASIHMHMAGFLPRWVNNDMLWAAFHYPFVQLGCDRVFGQVPETNTKTLEIDARLGFKEVARVQGVFRDGACVVLSMERADCRWLNLRPRNTKAGAGTLDHGR